MFSIFILNFGVLVVFGDKKNLTICILWINLDPSLVLVIIARLKEKYTEAFNRSDVKAVVLTGRL